MSQSKIIISAPAIHHNASRRLFMRQASVLSAVAGAGAPLALNLLAAGSAAAQTASDYRAIVCLFMFGGNDAFNMVLPTDSVSWAAYAKMRSSLALMPPSALPTGGASPGSPAKLGGVRAISPLNPQVAGRTYALHPLMTRMQSMFDIDKRLAIVSNIGPLVAPTNKAQYNTPSYPLPPRLFSHNDQQSMWQTMMPEGATQGWGGRLADMIAGGNEQAVFTAISAAGGAVWLSGEQVRQYQVSASGALRLGADKNGLVYGSTEVAKALDSIVQNAPSGHNLERYLAQITERSITSEGILRDRLRLASEADFGTPPLAGGGYNPSTDPKLMYLSPDNGQKVFSPLAHQLQMVARLVDAGMAKKTGVRRQVFFVSLGGFDTHSNQNPQHTELMARVAHAMEYFDSALGNIKAHDNVTTFTGSDFGRTFTSNGDGTDHGWGAHQFVMGGAVKGGDLYGRFPTLLARNQSGEFDSPDQVRNGALLPTTSVDQLGATLGRWFGVSDDNVDRVFPNLKNFNRDLGFMKS
ncbi:MAG: DUF1501 domain-containing protein [Betaproteobacteria bacterium]|nr:MAG: DUF1501 domain-containing protein [Betaproteobacteria bacterium]